MFSWSVDNAKFVIINFYDFFLKVTGHHDCNILTVIKTVTYFEIGCLLLSTHKNWFVRFVYDNFAKRRGQLGYNLNMTEDDIILMTKICINNNEKMKLNKLFDEFELRGIFFDRDSKTKIVQLYEKLNLLEKKSDSGDAQYVRSVL